MQQDHHDPKEPANPANEEAADPIENPEQVEESNDEKIDQDFPGYPHYPANDDLLDPDNNTGQEPVDVENLSRAHKITAENLSNAQLESGPDSLITDEEESDIKQPKPSDTDITKEDLAILGALDGDRDLGEDDAIPDDLKVTGFDLDVPGSELDDDMEDVGEEDEENNYYSLGGDNHEDVEQGDRTL